MLEVLRIAPSAILFDRREFFSALPVFVDQFIDQLFDLGARDEQRANAALPFNGKECASGKGGDAEKGRIA